MALVMTPLLDFQYRNGELCLMVKCVSVVSETAPLEYRVSSFDTRSAPMHNVTGFGEDDKAAIAWALCLRAGMMSAAKGDIEHCTAEVVAYLAARTE